MFFSPKVNKGRREYLRLDSVFPVTFRLLALDEKEIFSDWIQGFTSNISRGGICLSVNNLNPRFKELIKNKAVKLSLNIEMPIKKTPIAAKAKIAWLEDVSNQSGERSLIGLAYEEIPGIYRSRIFRYALAKKIFPRLSLTVLFILLLSFSISGYLNLKLIRGNKTLINQFVDILQKSSIAKQNIKRFNQEKENLNLELSAMQIRLNTLEEEKLRIAQAEKEKAIAEEEAKLKIESLMELIERLKIDKSELQDDLISLQTQESQITEDLLLLDRKKTDLERVNFEKMYQWLKVHQNLRTGLVLSYEGDEDLDNWSFLYDQALSAIAFIHFNDFERARKIFQFFKSKAKKVEGGFLNAYYADNGAPAEYIIHCGPNIWLAISLLHYTQKTQDNSYLDFAKDIADWTIEIQRQDPEGGIRGGPKVPWYSTEHNLDAYALFNMLYAITAEHKYLRAAQVTLDWLKLHIYDRPDIPIIRGKGDSTIATDTYAWSIAAIGPEKLQEIGMNPDQIVEFAEEACAIETEYLRPSGISLRVKGFDFAPARHMGRGGVVSCEWTAQMVLAYKLMARFYHRKDMLIKTRFYEMKADDYLSQLCKMIISSPSPAGLGQGCLPYATQDSVDTGHGWSTPKGKRTGSVAATAYALFAYYGYNPLELPD